jgi:hypothetical protein
MTCTHTLSLRTGPDLKVRVGDPNGPVVGTFSNRLAAETFTEKNRVKDQGALKTQTENGLRCEKSQIELNTQTTTG